MFTRLWRICAVLLFLDNSFSMQCKWTQCKLGNLNRENIKLLNEMGGSFPPKCLDENVKLMFPKGVYESSRESQNGNIASVAYDALRDVAIIFDDDLNSTTWDREKLELFRNKMSRQVEMLEKCIRGEVTYSGDGSSSSEDNGMLKSYFEKLNALLKEKKEKGQIACAWEVVRTDVLFSLEELQKFLKRRRKQCLNEVSPQKATDRSGENTPV